MTTDRLVTRSGAVVCTLPARFEAALACDSFRASPRPRGVCVGDVDHPDVNTPESDLSVWPTDTRTRRLGVATSPASAGCSPVPWSSGTVLGLLVDHAAGTRRPSPSSGLALASRRGAAAFWVRVRSALR